MRLAYDPWDGNNSSQTLMYGELVISPKHGSSLTTVSTGMNGTGGAMVNCLTTGLSLIVNGHKVRSVDAVRATPDVIGRGLLLGGKRFATKQTMTSVFIQ